MGGHDIKAEYSGDGVYAASYSDTTINISPKQTTVEIDNPGTQTNAEGDAVSLTIVSPNADANSFSATNLPAGLKISPSGLISGTVAAFDAQFSPYIVTVSATYNGVAGSIVVVGAGGFSISGAGSVAGSGVMIYIAGSDFPNNNGKYGSVTISGSGADSLTPATSGLYAGLLIFQARTNSNVLSLSGSGVVTPGGAIYAPAAALSLTGSASFKGTVIVNTLNDSGAAVLNDVAGDAMSAYTPEQVRSAYGVNNLSLDGTDQTIAIVDAYDNPAIYQSLDAFDTAFSATASGPSLFQLDGPASSFLTVLNQQGQASSLPSTDPTGAGAANWEIKEALDVEWVHATASGARIILVEANSQSLADLMTGVATAAAQPGVSVVSMSWGFQDGVAATAQDEAPYDSYLTTPAGHQGVTFVVSTGDSGSADAEYPAFSPNVLAVGGTSLLVNADGSYGSETGWGGSDGAGSVVGGGGGGAQYEAEPAFQSAVQSTGFRTIPDVSLIADPSTGAWVADPYNLGADNPWLAVGGTSLSAPSWAGLIALANQARTATGTPTLNSGGPTETQQAVYDLPESDFHDITSGSNGAFNAGVGYDLVTGLGTPVADRLVTDLAAFNGTVQSNRTITVTAASVAGASGGSGAGGVFNLFDAEIVAIPGRGQTATGNLAAPVIAEASRPFGPAASASTEIAMTALASAAPGAVAAIVPTIAPLASSTGAAWVVLDAAFPSVGATAPGALWVMPTNSGAPIWGGATTQAGGGAPAGVDPFVDQTLSDGGGAAPLVGGDWDSSGDFFAGSPDLTESDLPFVGSMDGWGGGQTAGWAGGDADGVSGDC